MWMTVAVHVWKPGAFGFAAKVKHSYIRIIFHNAGVHLCGRDILFMILPETAVRLKHNL